MSVYERIQALCKEKGIAVTALEKELGFGRGSIGKLKNVSKNTSAGRMQKIADYFGVTPEYLITGEKREGYYLNEETVETAQSIFENKELRILFDAARNASPEDIKTAADVLLALKRKEEYNGND